MSDCMEVIDSAWEAIQTTLQQVNLVLKLRRQKYDICSDCITFIKEAHEKGDTDSEKLKKELKLLGDTCRSLVLGFEAKLSDDSKAKEEVTAVRLAILKLFIMFNFPVDLENVDLKSM